MGRFFKRDFNTLMRNKNLKNCKGLDFGGKENREKHLECTNIRKKKKRYVASKLNGQDALPIVAKILSGLRSALNRLTFCLCFLHF